MNTELYLDTARLGQMCRGARMAEQDFSGLASQLRSPLYCGRFLTDGLEALASCDRRRFTALRCWSGVAEFKREFGRLVSQPSCPTFLFSASQSLIHFAAECLFDSARLPGARVGQETRRSSSRRRHYSDERPHTVPGTFADRECASAGGTTV